MSEPSRPKERKESRIRRLLIRLAIVSAVLIGVLAFLLGSLIGREYLKEIPRPTDEVSTREFLRPVRAVDETTTQTTGNFKQQKNPEPERARMRGNELKFEPMIPDTPDIPEALKARAAELNGRFDTIFRRIEEFERTKDKLPAAEAIEIFERLHGDYTLLSYEMQKPFNFELADSGGQGRIADRELKYLYSWFFPTAIQLRERAGDRLGAANLSHDFWRQQRSNWWSPRAWKGFVETDYDRENQYRDYYRTLYYYRQVGGFKGFWGVGQVFLEQKKREWLDALGRFRSGN